MLTPILHTSSINTHGANTAHPQGKEKETDRRGNSWSEQNILPTLASLCLDTRLGSGSVGFADTLLDCQI